MKNTEVQLLMQIVKDIKSDVSDVKVAIYGNGKPGLANRVQCVEDNQKNMAGKIGLISAFFGLVITGMFEIITRFFGKKIGL